jgi:hypothetical protein
MEGIVSTGDAGAVDRGAVGDDAIALSVRALSYDTHDRYDTDDRYDTVRRHRQVRVCDT